MDRRTREKMPQAESILRIDYNYYHLETVWLKFL